jgi:hypothetical protein
MDEFDDRPIHLGRVIIGGLLVAVGIGFLLDRLFIIQPWVLESWFPVALIAFGITRIVWPSRPGKQIGGAWIALAGGLLLFDRLGVIAIRESWPAFVIMAGLMLVFRALRWLPGSREWRDARWPEVRR